MSEGNDFCDMGGVSQLLAYDTSVQDVQVVQGCEEEDHVERDPEEQRCDDHNEHQLDGLALVLVLAVLQLVQDADVAEHEDGEWDQQA